MAAKAADLGSAAMAFGSVVPPFSLQAIQGSILAHFKDGDIDRLARTTVVDA